MTLLRRSLFIVLALFCVQTISFGQCENDTTPPVITVPDDITIDCDEDWPPIPPVYCWDDCDEALIPTFTFWYVDNKCGFQSQILLWSATDQAGNSTSETMIVEKCDLSPPDIMDCPEDLVINCDDPIPAPAELTITDNCSEFSVEFTETTQELGCPQEQLITRTWVATDIYDNASECVQTITIVDEESPVIIDYNDGVQLVDITVSCDEVPGQYTANAVDNCDEDVEIIFTEKILPGPCEDSYTIYRSYLAVDDCGNLSALDEHNITVVDDEAPVISGGPADVTVNCDNIPAANPNLESQNLLANSSFESPGVHDFGFGALPGNPPWTTDWFAFGPAFALDQNVIGSASDGDFYLKMFGAVSGVFQDQVVSAGDVVEGSIDIQNASFDPMAPGCVGFIKIEFFNAGNGFLGVVQSPSVDFTLPQDVWTEVSVSGEAPAGTAYARFVAVMECPFGGAVMFDNASMSIQVDEAVTDNCDADVDLTFEETSTPWDGCQYLIFRTWTATDNCGNSSSYTQTITVEDIFAPVLSETPADITLGCNDPIPAPPTVTATDLCDGDVPVAFTVASSTSCPGQMEMTRTWTASDACGNTTSHTQTISVVDNDGPTINHNLDLNITVECDAIPAAENLTATDDCSSATVSHSDISFVGPCDATYTINRVYVAFDECGNTSSVTQVINVVDNTAPTFDPVPQDGDIACPAQGGVEPDEIDAQDNCDPDVDVWFEDSFGSCSITRTWYAQDDCGNTATATQVLSFDDNTPPTFDNVPADVTVECDNVPGEGEVSASDDCSAAFVTVNDKVVPGSCPGNYTILRTYIAVDACGNTATESQTITVQDTTPPSLPSAPADATVSCDNIPPANMTLTNMNVLGNASFELPGFHDYAFGPIPGFPFLNDWFAFGPAFAIDQNVVIGSSAQDGDFFVKMFGAVSGLFQDFPVSPGDNIDASVYIQNASFDPMLPGCVGILKIEYKDDFDNLVGVPIEASVDHTIPLDVWTQVSVSDVVPAGASYVRVVPLMLCPAGGAVMFDSASLVINGLEGVTDNCDPNPTLSFDEDTFSDGDCLTTIIRTWTATDHCGNSDSVSQVLTVVDNDPPSLTVGADLTLECDETLPAPLWSASDNCGTPTVSVSPEIIPGDCPQEYVMVRTYTATDACGNSTSATQTLTVVDTTSPTFVNPPADEVLVCNPEIPPVNSPDAVDNCDPNVTVTFAQELEFDVNFGGGVIGDKVTRTWTAMDNCGNSEQHVQMIALIPDCPSDGCIDIVNFHNKPEAVTVDPDFNANKVRFFWNPPADAVKAQARLISANGTSYHLIHNLNFPKNVNKGFFTQGIEYTVQIRYYSEFVPCKIGSKWSDGTVFVVGGSSALAEPQDGNPFADTISAKDLADDDSNHLTIFPNPNNGEFYIETDLTDYNIEIFDLSGRTVSAKGQFNLNQSFIELESMTPGVYVVRLFNDSASLTERLIIE